MERSFSETQVEVNWGEHSRPSGAEGPTLSTCQRAAQPWDGIKACQPTHTTSGHSCSVLRWSSKCVVQAEGLTFGQTVPTHKDVPHPHSVWCREQCPWPLRLVGQSHEQIQLVGDTAVLSYIIIRAAKSSSRRRNCQNKGCQSNFNSTSWQICLLMGSLITSSQPTFSSTRLLLYSGHDGQTAINEGPVNILFCPFFIPCVAPGIICHMPPNPCS